ncbi:plasmid replication protein RepC [Rhizobium sp. CF080]|uniref:plasmid replication protein RepC n=1 Tax=Rhizobium sp. (strain CF080) TaxID=1144310 RepID=UPI00055E5F05|nr:plasmid replication protein RepC [Rhizobium sp. CF080]
MESRYVTTPFGRRAMSLGMLANQQLAGTIEPGTTRNKWKLFRAVCEARPSLGVTDRALTVLDALLTFYPDDELSEARGLVVFPSNAQLSLRARGMTAATLRRHLAVLINAGLILRKDSPNGKRYARRDRVGEIDEAFGFSLAPLLARAAEIECLAAQVIADRQLLRITRDRLTICRRDVAKLIAAAFSEGVPGDWGAILEMYRVLVGRIPRVVTVKNLSPILEEMAMLRSEIINLLEIRVKTPKKDASESQIERHKQNSKLNYNYESEPLIEMKPVAPPDHLEPQSEPAEGKQSRESRSKERVATGKPLQSFPLGLVLQACPQIADYGPGGRIDSWRDLMAAAVVVRMMLGVSSSAHEEACMAMGAENAATVIACILERGGHINSAGGYLRDLTRRTERGEFAIGPMLMALARAGSPGERQAG